jgi:hypothetical protein
VSQWFVVWFLENFPDRKVIFASYESDFAASWGAKVRDTIMEHEDSLTVRMKSKNPAQHYFQTSAGGGMSCVGAGGAITGKGANLLIIDDACKNMEEAKSVTMREKLWQWWTSTARTRIEPSVDPATGKKIPPGVVIIGTRWHSDDLIGRLINPDFTNEDGVRENWEVFVFPAEADPEAEHHYRQFGVKVNDLRAGSMSGQKVKTEKELMQEALSPQWRDFLGRAKGDPLCPERFGKQDLALLKGGSLSDWYALFQQRPGDEACDGNVYYRFDEYVNLKSLTRDERMKLFVAMDFNVDPMCAVIGQMQQSSGIKMMERCEVLEEIVLKNSNTPEMMSRLLMELAKYKYGYTLEVDIYGDAAGTQRSSQSQKSNWTIVSEYFQLDPTIHPKFLRKKANPPVVDRVNAVNTMFKAADGSTRLFVDSEKCQELVLDFKRVKWQTDSGGSPTGLIDKSDKKRSHCSDCLGYQVEYNFGLRIRGGGRRGFMQ